jgi:GTP-binding protein
VKPVLVLVGRANVGKSTLFNRVTKSRDAIVHDLPGLTRDRHYGNAKHAGRELIVVDTGGFEPVRPTGVTALMAKQTEQAVTEADVVVFVVDVRTGLSGHDQEIARWLRTAGRPVVVAVNKAEGMSDAPQVAEFWELGLGAPLAVSAAHGQGIGALLDAALAAIASGAPEDDAEALPEDERPIRLAVAGRPNTGKSTLINTWLGEPRLVAFDQPGTTRDAIVVPFAKDGQRFELVDTAGLRRRAKVFEAVEKFSAVKTLQAIDSAHVVLLLLDATQGVTDQDAHIAAYVLESGRAVVVAVNKWDATDDYQRLTLERSIASRLQFLRFAEVLRISALKRQGLAPVWKAILAAHAAAHRDLPTPQLTRELQAAVLHQQPPRAGRWRPKLRYAHQGGSNPPVIVVHGNSLEHVTDGYKRYLENRFRERFALGGTPLRIEMRSGKNPFAEREG